MFKETQPPKHVYSQGIVDIHSDHEIKLFSSARMGLSQEDEEPKEREQKQGRLPTSLFAYSLITVVRD